GRTGIDRPVNQPATQPAQRAGAEHVAEIGAGRSARDAERDARIEVRGRHADPRSGGHEAALGGADGFLRLVDVEFHPIELLEQVVRKLDIGLVDLVDQQHRQFGRSERLPQLALADIVGDLVDARIAELAVAQAGDRVI
ncbi:hypothetical protein QU38_01130, partial [Staphylococcus aureus]